MRFVRWELVNSSKATAIPRRTVGMRDLLCDSALLVTALTTGANEKHFATLRSECKTLVAQFDAALERRNFTVDVRADAIVAQCALLDETALRHLHDNDKANWIAEPLQVERLAHHNAGEYVFERLNARMRDARVNVELLECYAAILGLGFMGRYSLDGETQRDALIATLNAQIERLRPAQPALLTEHGGRRMSDWFRRLSPWAIAATMAVLALVVWLIWHVALDAQLAASFLKPVKP
jgi:type VI secretion system protein ImpK